MSGPSDAPTIIGIVTVEHRDRCSTIIRSARRRQQQAMSGAAGHRRGGGRNG